MFNDNKNMLDTLFIVQMTPAQQASIFWGAKYDRLRKMSVESTLSENRFCQEALNLLAHWSW